MPATFTYTDTWPADRDYLRWLIGDTNTTYRKFYDEELTEILSVRAGGKVNQAAGLCCRILSQDPDRLVLTWQGMSGAITLRELQSLYARRAVRFFRSAEV